MQQSAAADDNADEEEYVPTTRAIQSMRIAQMSLSLEIVA